MPIHIAAQGVYDGLSSIPFASTLLKLTAVLAVVALLKRLFAGTTNTSERSMHSKVVLMTVSAVTLPHTRRAHG